MTEEYSNSNWATLDKDNNNPKSRSQFTHQLKEFYHQKGIELQSKRIYTGKKGWKETLLLGINLI